MASSDNSRRDNSNDDGSPRNYRPRQPRNLEGVLQMAIANTGEDSEEQHLGPLDTERKEFLEKVFSEMCKDETKEIKSLLEMVAQKMDSENEEDEEAVEDALETTKDLCDTFDNAQDFHKTGGTSLLPRLMDHSRSEVRWRAFDLIANLVQNVPLNQRVLLEMRGVEILLEAVDKDASEKAKVKALYALSCLVRDNEDCQEIFARNDGFSVLMRAMQSNIEKLQIKSAFMLKALFQTPTGLKDTLHNMGMVHQLIGLLQTDHAHTHEHFMSALLNLVTDHEGCINDCRQPEVGLKQFLTERLEMLKDKPEFQEEYSYCSQLMDVCFGGNRGNGTAVDR